MSPSTPEPDLNSEAIEDIVAKLHIHRNSPIPRFLQLKSQFEYLIVTGVCSPGQRLPSIRMVSAALNVGPATIARAYHELEMARLVVSSDKLGFFVVGGEVARSEPHERIQAMVTEVIDNAIAEGISLDQVFEIFVAQIANMRMSLARPQIALIGKREGRIAELAMHIRHALADLNADVSTVTLEQLTEDIDGWLPTLQKMQQVVCLLWNVKQAQELLMEHGIDVLPLRGVLRDDIREKIAALPEDVKVGIVASSNQFIDGMITAAMALNPALKIVGSTDAQHRKAMRALCAKVDCIIYGTPARAVVKQELHRPIDEIELVYVPDPASLQQLRRLLHADLHQYNKQPNKS